MENAILNGYQLKMNKNQIMCVISGMNLVNGEQKKSKKKKL